MSASNEIPRKKSDYTVCDNSTGTVSLHSGEWRKNTEEMELEIFGDHFHWLMLWSRSMYSRGLCVTCLVPRWRQWGLVDAAGVELYWRFRDSWGRVLKGDCGTGSSLSLLLPASINQAVCPAPHSCHDMLHHHHPKSMEPKECGLKSPKL